MKGIESVAMVIAAIVALSNFVLIVSLWSVFWLFRRSIEGIEARTREDLARALRVLIEPPGENQPSPLAVYSDQFATLLAGRFMQAVKASMAGVASGEAKAAATDGLAAAAAKSPLLAIAAAFLPKKFRNAILASPQFTGQLSMLGSGGNHEAGSTSNVRQRLEGGM